MNLLRRLTQTQRSLRLRLLGATLTVLAIALAVSVLGFEHVARGVVLDAAHSHLTARAREVLEATERFQRERELTAHNWAEAEAMQLSLDSGDPKFAEDYLKRAIQDQGGAFSLAALPGADEGVVSALLEPGAPTRRPGLELYQTPATRWLAVRTETLPGVPGWR